MLFTVLNTHNNIVINHKIDNDGFEDEELVTLTIAVNDPAFILIEEDEFIYNDLLFDIIELKQENGWLQIKAYWDKKEEKLTADFIARTKSQHENKKDNHPNISIKQILKDYTGSTDLHLTYFASTNINGWYNEFLYLPEASQNIFIPPPEV